MNVNNMEGKEAYASWLLDTKRIVGKSKVRLYDSPLPLNTTCFVWPLIRFCFFCCYVAALKDGITTCIQQVVFGHESL